MTQQFVDTVASLLLAGFVAHLALLPLTWALRGFVRKFKRI